MTPAWPSTIVVVHPKERRSKCTLKPVRGRVDLLFVEFPPVECLDFRDYVRLSVEGPELSPQDDDQGLLLLDGSWRHVNAMNEYFAAVPPRSLPPAETAYPRTSKLYADPDAGLASVEALFLAYHVLGRDTRGLLDRYHWQQEFLRRNQVLLGDF